MKIAALGPGEAEGLDRYLLSHPSSLFYYCSKYKNFLKELLGCQEAYLLATEDSRIRGVLPLMFMEGGGGRVYNSLPYYGSNGGVIADTPLAADKLIDAYNEIASHTLTLSSTVISNPFADQNTENIRHNYTDQRIAQFTRIEFGEDHQHRIMEAVDSSAARNVRKAVREGVTVEIDHTRLDRLRQMHQENIRAIGGIPKTDRLFALIPEHFTPGLDFDLYVAKKDGLVIAGLLVFYFNRTVEYFTPATDSEYRSDQPLSLILMQAMTDASRRGFTCWNWGATWVNQTGVYRFKKKWGAAERAYHYHTQLNEVSILDWPAARILSTFPNFYVAPFSALHSVAGEAQ